MLQCVAMIAIQKTGAGKSLISAAQTCGLPLEVIACQEAKVVEAYECALVLVRPDGHVCWRANAEPADAKAVIDTVRGA